VTPLSPFVAHAACALIAIADLAARSLRLSLLGRSVGQRLSTRDAFLSIIWADAASGVTPMRFGGEPAKLGGLIRARLPLGPALIVLGLEMVVTYPWAQTGPSLAPVFRTSWPWIAAVVVLTAASLWLWWRHAHRPKPTPPAVTPLVEAVRPRLRDAWRTIHWGPVLLAAPLSLVNIIGRTAMLPLLVMTLPDHAPQGVLWVGSFALLYSQLVLPTPAGAGPVELGFLSGAAGNLGPEAALLLVAWRFYTVGLGVILGAWAAVRVLGWQTVSGWVRRPGVAPSPPA
jgi:uncharacterized membrane protein YbhN (UPF0104 family)